MACSEFITHPTVNDASPGPDAASWTGRGKVKKSRCPTRIAAPMLSAEKSTYIDIDFLWSGVLGLWQRQGEHAVGVIGLDVGGIHLGAEAHASDIVSVT